MAWHLDSASRLPGLIHRVRSWRSHTYTQMGFRELIRDRLYPAKQLVRLWQHLSNWAPVAFALCQRRPVPPLRFRGGMVLNYGIHDDPIGLFREIYIDRLYGVTPTPGTGILLDIGANIGAVTQYYLRLYPGLKAHAYEPNPDAFKMLETNMEASNAPVQIFPEAIGRQRGTLSLWVDVTTTFSTAYSESNPVPGGTGGRTIDVPTINLDEAWERAGRPSIWLLKIDTEGAEGDILEGASPSCLAHVQNAVVEYHDNIVSGVSQRCKNVLARAGFSWSTRKHPWNEGILYCTRSGRTTSTTSACR